MKNRVVLTILALMMILMASGCLPNDNQPSQPATPRPASTPRPATTPIPTVAPTPKPTPIPDATDPFDLFTNALIERDIYTITGKLPAGDDRPEAIRYNTIMLRDGAHYWYLYEYNYSDAAYAAIERRMRIAGNIVAHGSYGNDEDGYLLYVLEHSLTREASDTPRWRDLIRAFIDVFYIDED